MTTTPTFNNQDNINAVRHQLLSTIASLTKRAEIITDVSYAMDSLPDYVEVPSNFYDYSTYDLKFTLHLPDDKDNNAVWRANARKIADVRKLFQIKDMKRSPAEDGSVYYVGRGKLPGPYSISEHERDIMLVVPQGGLPPTCTVEVTEEEVTHTYTRKVVKTNCQPQTVNA